MSTLKWTTTRRRVNDLIPWHKNPRKISDAQLEKLKTSIERFNYAAPILIDEDQRIVAGHQRCKALIALGRGNEEIDVRIASRKLTEAEFEELAIRDNKNHGEWDFEGLAKFDEQLLKTIGFDAAELDKIFKNTARPAPDEAPEPRAKTDIKAGDMFMLGDHTLLCGDSTNDNDVKKLMGGGVADMVFTDPPWNVAIGKDSNPRHRQRAGLINDDLGEDFRAFLDKFTPLLSGYCKGDIYVVMGCEEWPNIHGALTGAGLHWSATIAWVKDIFVLGRSKYHRRYEPIWYGWRDKSSFVGDRKQDDVWEIERPRVSKEHPTMKPVALCERAILNSSPREGVVLDLFGGSGSTLMACEQASRKCRMIEIDPIYCQVIIDRWEKHTGQKAEKL